jgi:class 3 adenylate cyclase
MECPKCRADNPDDNAFCRKCGAKLVKLCPQCGSEYLPVDVFCGKCGHDLGVPSEPSPKEFSIDEQLEKIKRYLPKALTDKVLAQRDKIEGERKQVSVMFCDMVGFTPLSEMLGPEEAYSIMDQVYEILIHQVHDYEGTVNEMTGDGIMALFGAPIALEDAPQRAIRSAYAIHREITRFNDRIEQERGGSLSIKMRIGIHTGPVVVGTLGNDLRVEFKAVGDTVNLASRVEGLAQPGTSYVSEHTFKLTEGLFRFEALGEKAVKGKREPVRVYRVIAPSTRRTRFDISAERGLTPLVGRERELELLLDGFRRAKGGRGQAFSITAEAGVGKSRVLYEFRKAVANEDVTFLEGKCLSYSRGVAYHPVIDILKASFEVSGNDSDAVKREKVEEGLRTLGAEDASTLPYILELLSVKDSGIDQIPLSPEAKKARILEALERIIMKGSEIRPLIMAIEDLHWVDESSEESFKDLLDSISGARVLLLFTYRPEFVHTWGGRSYHSQVNLNRLSNRESLIMASNLLGTDDIAKELEEYILGRTEGVPFFIEEFVKSLKDLKVLQKRGSSYTATKDLQNVSIPSTIQDVIMARVDSLPEAVKKLLQTGSVIGREFSYELIREVMGVAEKELKRLHRCWKDSFPRWLICSLSFWGITIPRQDSWSRLFPTGRGLVR